jgi:hypothetical protein
MPLLDLAMSKQDGIFKYKRLLLAKYQGPRATRFKTLPPVTRDIGPGCYELNEVRSILTQTDITNQVMKKPTSKLGVAIVKGVRFPKVQSSVKGFRSL